MLKCARTSSFIAFTNSRQFEGVLRNLLDNLQSQVLVLEVAVVKDTVVEEAGSSISSHHLTLNILFSCQQ